MKPIQKWQTRAAMVVCFGCLLALAMRSGFAQSDVGLTDVSRTFDPAVVEPNGLATVNVLLEGAYCSAESDVTGVDVALVLDRSGSMDGEPLELAISAAKGFLKRASSEIDGTDRVGVISFDEIARTEAPIGSPVVQTAGALDALTSGGSTSISGGIDEAVSALSIEAIETNAQAMIVLSDGFHNEGRDPEPAAQEACDVGIQLFTIGLGDSVDPLLETIPCNGGRYFPAPTPQDLNDIYQLIANDVLGVVATDVVVREMVPAGLTVEYVSDSGIVSENEDETVIEWRIPLLEETSRTFSYQVSGNEVGDYDFVGDVVFDGCEMTAETRQTVTNTLTPLTVEEGAGSSEPITETVESGEINTSDTADFIILTQDELTCEYDWVDVSRSPSFFQLADDQFRDVILADFPFLFGGEMIDAITVSNNGGVFFGTPDYLHWDNQPLSEITSPGVFPLWDDWLGGTVIATYNGDAPNRDLVIEWTDREHYWLRGDTVTFQMILTEGTSNIKIQYRDVDYAGNELWTTPPPLVNNGGSATIGIIPASGNAMQIAHNQPNAVTSGSAFCMYAPGDIEITTGVSVNDTSGMCSQAQEIDVLIGQEVTWCYQVSNTTAADITLEGIGDTQFGLITADTLTLVPGESAVFTRTATVTETVVHETLWSVSGDAVYLDSAPWGTVTLGGQLQQNTQVNVIPAGLKLDMTVALSADECGLYDTLTPPLGAVIVTCYEVQNTHPAVTYTTHTLVDSELGTLLTDELIVLSFGETAVFTTTSIVEAGETIHNATWTGNGTESATDTIEIVTQSISEPLQCGQTVYFEYGVPNDWQTEGNLDWVPNVSASCNQPNHAGGGVSMCVDGTAVPEGESFSATLLTNPINVNGYTLSYLGDYYDMTQPFPFRDGTVTYDTLIRFNVAYPFGSSSSQTDDSFTLFATNSSGTIIEDNLFDSQNHVIMPLSTLGEQSLDTYAVSLTRFIGMGEIRLGFTYTGGDGSGMQIDSLGMACGEAPMEIGDPSDSLDSWARVDNGFVATTVELNDTFAGTNSRRIEVMLLVGMSLISVIMMTVRSIND